MVTALDITAYQLALRYVGIHEIAGQKNHPLVQWWLSLCGFLLDAADEVPWCSAFVNGIAWELRLPRSKSAAARSWLRVGTPVMVSEAEPLFDVIVLARGNGEQPGADVIEAPGHVGFYAGRTGMDVLVLGGNQSDGVCIESFPSGRVLGVRRLA